MALQPEAIEILRVFANRDCKVGDVLSFTDFGDAIIWEAGGIRDEGMRSGLRELINDDYVVEYMAGLGITSKGLKVIRGK